MIVKDHLGNEFNTITEMCAFYGVSESTFWNRRKRGCSLEETLAVKPCQNVGTKKCQDHLGNEYESVRAMYEAYGLSEGLYYGRKSNNWDLERILTTKKSECKASKDKVKKECTDHLGNKFASLKEMCNFHGIEYSLYSGRIKCGYSVERALTEKKNVKKQRTKYGHEQCTDHLGNTFTSMNKMCEFHGIIPFTYRNRRKKGMSVEEALSKGRCYVEKKKCQDHLGNWFSSKKKMCDYYHVPTITFYTRIRHGDSLEDALTKQVRKKRA